MENIFIEGIHATCLFGRFDLIHRFHSGINIIYGINGSGKTTLLHILTNILRGDFWRFFFVTFNEIEVFLSNQRSIKVIRSESRKFIRIRAFIDNNPTPIFSNVVPKSVDYSLQNYLDYLEDNDIEDNYINNKLFPLYIPDKVFVDEVEQKRGLIPLRQLVNSVYIPAFRRNIDLLLNSEKSFLSEQERYRSVNNSLRLLYGQFTPDVLDLSINEIQSRISREITSNGYSTILELSDQIINENNISKVVDKFVVNNIDKDLIEKLEILNHLTKLSGYQFANSDISINEMKQKVRDINIHKSVRPLQNALRFLELVNQFLEGKKIRISKQSLNGTVLGIEFEKNTLEREFHLLPIIFDLSALSSGERQLFSIIYSLIYLKPQSKQSSIILFDEPEISLNLDWQRRLLKELFSDSKDQVLVGTHSSALSVNWTRDDDTELLFSPTNSLIEYMSDEQLIETDNEDDKLVF